MAGPVCVPVALPAAAADLDIPGEALYPRRMGLAEAGDSGNTPKGTEGNGNKAETCVLNYETAGFRTYGGREDLSSSVVHT